LAQVEVPQEIPMGKVGIDPRNIWVTLYGMDEWWKLFTPRQLVALTTFSDLLVNSRERVESDALASGMERDGVHLRDGGTGATAYADAVITYLAFAVDKATNLWSSCTGWMNDRGAFREVFARQAISMAWDYAEANPFSGRGGDWSLFVDKIRMAIKSLPTHGSGESVQRDARARIAEVGTCLISTDPPYYDNISYADLSDFFYVWLRRNLAGVWPDETSTLLTPKAEELIANQYRAGSKKAANQHFESGMEEVFAKAAECADPRFPAAIFYAFKAAEGSAEGLVSTGWETFLSGLLKAGYSITATWPVRTESPGRILASGSNALASSIVLACRPREVASSMATRGEFIGALRAEMIPAVRLLQKENIAPVDMAQSAMGPGIAIFSRYPKVVEADGSSMSVRTALALINEVLSEALSGEESEFDADTRFAVTWFEQFGHNPGPAGDAITLATAKNTSVAGVETSGIASSRDGKFRLLDRGELDEGWDPANDIRLTVWEATQYLIRALDDSETAAADLLRRIGQGFGERARQLAYLLYGICDRNKWANEASAYNMLVTAWPEIERLAASAPVGETVDDDRLF
jgi:putative DNA methylase